NSVVTNADFGSCSISNIDLGTPITADNCGIASLATNAPTVYFAGTTNVIWTVTDIHGNSAICTQLVTIVDTEPPAIICPANVTTNANAGQCYATGLDLGVPGTNDNCGVANLNNDAPSQFPVGITTVHWTATDIHGNSNTCAQIVTVTDNQPPTISCP